MFHPEFTTQKWSSEDHKYILTIHKTTAISLYSDNEHSIPNAFELGADCGARVVESRLKAEPVHIRYPDVYNNVVRCEKCWEKESQNG